MFSNRGPFTITMVLSTRTLSALIRYICIPEMKASLNISRLQYLLDLYAMSTEELLQRMSEGLVNAIPATDVFTEEIKVSYLKKIDKIFQKGLAFYVDPSSPPHGKSSSIFFRKDQLADQLSLGAKKAIDNAEQQQRQLSAYAKLTNIDLRRRLPVFSTSDAPGTAAKVAREHLYPTGKTQNTKRFLERLIVRLSEQRIFVFEFVETWNKKEKANINGAFLAPNAIVLKRQQQSLKREVFTLSHEIGHYLLNEETAEEVDFNSSLELNKIERWCDAFAYHFLIGDQEHSLMSSVSNDRVDEVILQTISRYTHLSISALYTQLLLKKKISYVVYKAKMEAVAQYLAEQRLKAEAAKQLTKELGLDTGRGSAPRPIRSPLHVSVLRNAFHEGLVNEMDFCKSLNIKAERIDKYLYE
jgi:Zn-dependent peptidase ImmA (M78 family)